MDYEDQLDASILQAIINVEHYYRDPYMVDIIIRIALGKENFHLSLALDGAARKNRESTSKNFKQKITIINIEEIICNYLIKFSSNVPRVLAHELPSPSYPSSSVY